MVVVKNKYKTPSSVFRGPRQPSLHTHHLLATLHSTLIIFIIIIDTDFIGTRLKPRSH